MTADQNTTEDFALKTSDSDTTNTSNGHDNESVTTKLIIIEESEDVDHVRVYPSDLNTDTYINVSKSGEAKSTTPFSNDIGTWTLVSDQKREHFCKQGSFACHHHDNEFNASGRIFQGETFKRHCTKSLVKKSSGIGSAIHNPRVNSIASYVNCSHRQMNNHFWHLVATQIGSMFQET